MPKEIEFTREHNGDNKVKLAIIETEVKEISRSLTINQLESDLQNLKNNKAQIEGKLRAQISDIDKQIEVVEGHIQWALDNGLTRGGG